MNLHDKLRKSIKVAYMERLYSEGKINVTNFEFAREKVDEVVDNLVCVEDHEKFTFYGIDGQPNDPNNIAAQFFKDDPHAVPEWINYGDEEE
jgi:hypothetical protein|tara:strand:+ start:1610 stop:1885 length:276 start_codon:yes stop_codon:yes gene_type:complete